MKMAQLTGRCFLDGLEDEEVECRAVAVNIEVLEVNIFALLGKGKPLVFLT